MKVTFRQRPPQDDGSVYFSDLEGGDYFCASVPSNNPVVRRKHPNNVGFPISHSMGGQQTFGELERVWPVDVELIITPKF